MSRIEKLIVVVNCAKLGRELEALNTPPFPGELGQRIYNEVSQMGYETWSEHATLLINHYSLNMADPRSQEFLFEQMEAFFFGDGSEVSGLSPQGVAPSKK